MPNTYTQIYIQIVFAVKYREALILPPWKERLHKYVTGIVQNQGHKLIAINTMPDHAHIFIGQRPDAALSDLVRFRIHVHRLIELSNISSIRKNIIAVGHSRKNIKRCSS